MFCVAWSVYSKVSLVNVLPRLGNRGLFYCYRFLVIMSSLFKELSSSFGFLGKNVSFYGGTPWVFQKTVRLSCCSCDILFLLSERYKMEVFVPE